MGICAFKRENRQYTYLVGNGSYLDRHMWSSLQRKNRIWILWISRCCWLGYGWQQSIFRSTFAKIIPDNTPNPASYFSFFDVSEKLAIVLGTFSYGIIADITGNMRFSIVALAVYFIIGFSFLIRIKNFKALHP